MGRNHQHRAWCLAQHLLRDGAEDHPFEATASMRAHDDDVGWDRDSLVDDRRRGVARLAGQHQVAVRRAGGLRGLRQPLKDLFSRDRVDRLHGATKLGGAHGHRIERRHDVECRQPGRRPARQGGRVGQRTHRRVTQIRWAQDVREFHHSRVLLEQVDVCADRACTIQSTSPGCIRRYRLFERFPMVGVVTRSGVRIAAVR